MNQDAVSLNAELLELTAAVEGARILCDLTRFRDAPTDHDERLAPHAASSILLLAVGRLKAIGRVVRGEVDPRLLADHHNVVQQQEATPGESLSPWTLQQRLDQARSEVAALERQLRDM